MEFNVSSQYLNTITENASRLGTKLQESFLESTRDLNINRGTSAAYLDTSDDRTKDIPKQLDSNSDREKLDAMKRLIALISKGRQVSEYFAQVVKNVASSNLEIRKLVYIYLLRYAEQEPNLALLSINTFQRDLADANPLIRAMALRVLSGIKVPMIGSIVVLAIKRCASDSSPYVRKTAALAIPKCYELDSAHLPALISIITSLLTDTSPLSLGNVAVAFEEVCPTRLDLLHQHYRRLCRILTDVDEWGQVDILNLLLRYVRTMLPRPSISAECVEEELDQDINLLLASAEPILQSRNPAVVMAAARTIYYGGPPSYHVKIVHPLLRLLNISKEVERVVLVYLLVVTQTVPQLFSAFFARFLVRMDDPQQVKKYKINLLTNVLTVDNYQSILHELVDYADDVDDSVVSASIQAIGRCASVIPESNQQCLVHLTNMIKSPYDTVVSSAVLVLKHLIQTQLSGGVSTITTQFSSHSPFTTIAQLARKIDDIRHAQARACVIWLVGQYASSTEAGPGLEGIAVWAPDVLRKTVKTFKAEESLVKLQVLTLASKLYVLCPTNETLKLLSHYVFSLARYDLDYDVRDRARMLSSLLSGVGLFSVEDSNREGVVLRREQVRLVLFEGKLAVMDHNTNYLDTAVLGSLSTVTGNAMRLDAILPDWLEKGVESSLRDSKEEQQPKSMATASAYSPEQLRPVIATPVETLVQSMVNEGAGVKGVWRDLDKFYEDSEEAVETDADSEGDADGSSGDESQGEEEEDSDEPVQDIDINGIEVSDEETSIKLHNAESYQEQQQLERSPWGS